MHKSEMRRASLFAADADVQWIFLI